MDLELTPRQMRLSATWRGFFVVALIGVYGYVFDQPGVSLAASLLIAAGLQILVLILRRVVPPDLLPQAMSLFELLVDAATVFLFALGVYGGLIKAGLSV